MSQHFPPCAKTLTLAQVMRMTNEEADAAFARIRWPETNGEPVCPECGCLGVYVVRRPKGGTGGDMSGIGAVSVYIFYN